MNLMIKASSIIEAYMTLLKAKKPEDTETVFENPSFKELKELVDRASGEVRFMADSQTKTVYAWEGTLWNHHDARQSLKIKCDMSRWSNRYVCANILDGLAVQDGSKFVMDDSDMLDSGFDISVLYRQAIFSQDWSWADKYIEVTPYIEHLKKIYRWP